MRVSRQKTAENRERIIDATGALQKIQMMPMLSRWAASRKWS
jgi:hypothetical protein